MEKVMFLVSAGGGTLKYIHRLSSMIGVEVVGVIADRECPAYEYAKEHRIPGSIVRYYKRSHELDDMIRRLNPDTIITTWHKILNKDTLDLPPEFINLHYSLLPAMKGAIGMEALQIATEKGCKFVGATLHQVNKDVDEGKIIGQAVMLNAPGVQDTLFIAACRLLTSWLQKSLGHWHEEINYKQVWFHIMG